MTAPQQARVGLALDTLFLSAERRRLHGIVEGVGLVAAELEGVREAREGIRRSARLGSQADPDLPCLFCCQGPLEQGRGLGACPIVSDRVHGQSVLDGEVLSSPCHLGLLLGRDQVNVEGVLGWAHGMCEVIGPQAAPVGFIVGEQECSAVAVLVGHGPGLRGKAGMASIRRDLSLAELLELPRGWLSLPGPCVAVPDLWKDMDVGWLSGHVGDADADQDVVDAGFGVFYVHLKVAPGLEVVAQNVLELGFLGRVAVAVLLGDPVERIGGMRIQVSHSVVAVGGRGVLVEIEFFHVLSVVAHAAAGQAPKSLLEDEVFAIPQAEAQTEALLIVAESGQPVFVPAVGAHAGVLVREEVPRVAIGRVVLGHGTPRSLRNVRTPPAPGLSLGNGIESVLFLGGHGGLHS